MAQENADGQEKTEDPSGKRISDARNKGQVARSRELNNAAMAMIGVLTLWVLLDHFGQGFWKVSLANFQIDRADIFDTKAMMRHFVDAIVDAMTMLTPFFAVMIVIAIVSSVALSGFIFSTESMKPKFSKINPITGMKRFVSLKSLVELGKSLIKFFLVGGATVGLLYLTMGKYLALVTMELEPAMEEMSWMLGWSVFLLSATLILVALVDVPFQVWDHKRQLKMTKQEVKDENKQSEGDPQVKGKIRQKQREAAMRRMMEAVPQADVIVTNPTHFAVALKYDQLRMRAPQVVAKGVDRVALNIRKVGAEHHVPVMEIPMLARALYYNAEIGEYVPQGLYLAVAKLLAYVYQLRTASEVPVPPDDYMIPEEYRTDPVV
ncbi:flagellar biosynthesis protein FlhB [Magnetovirga frankeli]|uniref:flagellar biosynthesis protein FlhB n=1 Tax=Magnetovirga frankeli TaxID=947516 RepID=UPI0012934F51|nr:flagellar biosynthesis protein FlhB [gamma proteobacterium SS-5]